MTVTPDVIGVIVAVFVAAVGFAGVVGGMLRRQGTAVDARFEQMQAYMDRRFDRIDSQFGETNTRISRVETEVVEMNARISRVENEVGETNTRISRVETEVVEMKIAIARLEGPPPRLAMR
ncbi:hypothetical protein [Microbacterium sp. KR10-403]|uniref:hypothetical protein n=1 Tax=Microbacterium sp. KR10-403 TaxID=3158581 RepID=UPI0032E4F279